MVSSRAQLPRGSQPMTRLVKKRVGRLNCRKHSDPLSELVSISDSYEWMTNCFYGNRNSEELLIMPKPLRLHQYLALFITAEGKWHCKNFSISDHLVSTVYHLEPNSTIHLCCVPLCKSWHMCVCTCMCACTCVHAYEGQRSTLLSFLIWLFDFCPALVLADDRLCWVAVSPRDHPLNLPKVLTTVLGIFPWVLGIELRSLCSLDRHFLPTELSCKLCLGLWLWPFCVFWIWVVLCAEGHFYFKLRGTLGESVKAISQVDIYCPCCRTGFPALSFEAPSPRNKNDDGDIVEWKKKNKRFFFFKNKYIKQVRDISLYFWICAMGGVILWKRPSDIHTVETLTVAHSLLYALFFVDILTVVLTQSAYLVKMQTYGIHMTVWAHLHLHDREGFTQLP